MDCSETPGRFRYCWSGSPRAETSANTTIVARITTGTATTRRRPTYPITPVFLAEGAAAAAASARRRAVHYYPLSAQFSMFQVNPSWVGLSSTPEIAER